MVVVLKVFHNQVLSFSMQLPLLHNKGRSREIIFQAIGIELVGTWPYLLIPESILQLLHIFQNRFQIILVVLSLSPDCLCGVIQNIQTDCAIVLPGGLIVSLVLIVDTQMPLEI